MSLYKKIIIIAGLILFVSIGVNTAIGTIFFSREYTIALQSRALAMSEILRSQLERLMGLGITLNELVGFEEQCQEIVKKYNDVVNAMVVSPEGVILFHSEPSKQKTAVSNNELLKYLKSKQAAPLVIKDYEEGDYDIVTPVYDREKRRVGVVVIEFPIQTIGKKVEYLIGNSFLVTIASLIIGVILLFLFMNIWLNRPLKKLTFAVDEIRKKGIDFEGNVQVKSRDELGMLAGSFNQMINDLRKVTVSRDELAREIAERKHAEERFRVVAQSTSDLIYEWDIRTGKLDWFGGIDARLGYGQGEFPRTIEAWENIIHPDDRVRVMAALESHIKEGRRYQEEYRVTRKDGSILYWIDSGSAIRDEQGNAYKMFGACSDISVRKQAVEDLKDSEERLKILFEHAPDATFLCDFKGVFTEGNLAAEGLTGYKNEELIGKSFLKINLLPAGEIVKAAALLTKVASGRPVGPEEIVIKRKDGRQVIAELRAFLVKIKGQTFILGSVREITEQKKLEDELKKKMESLERFNKIAVGRELKMAELKNRIAELEQALRQNGDAK